MKVVGSYLLGTVTKPDLNVDVSVQMPKVCIIHITFLVKMISGLLLLGPDLLRWSELIQLIRVLIRILTAIAVLFSAVSHCN